MGRRIFSVFESIFVLISERLDAGKRTVMRPPALMPPSCQIWVKMSRKCLASGAAAHERIAAKPAYNGSSTPDSSRKTAGQRPAVMCQKRTLHCSSGRPAGNSPNRPEISGVRPGSCRVVTFRPQIEKNSSSVHSYCWTELARILPDDWVFFSRAGITSSTVVSGLPKEP